MNTALRKIQARVKQLKKKHPGAKHRTLQKQAGAEYRAGKLKKRRKRVGTFSASNWPNRVGSVRRKRKAVKRKRRVAAVRVKRRKRVGTRPSGPAPVYMSHYTIGRVKRKTRKRRKARYTPVKRVTHCRRVGGMSKSTKNLLLIGGGLLAAYLFLKPSVTYPPITLTNPASINSANTIISAAQAAGASANAIANLIKTINASSDSQIQSGASTVANTGQLPPLYQSSLIDISSAFGPAPTSSTIQLPG